MGNNHGRLGASPQNPSVWHRPSFARAEFRFPSWQAAVALLHNPYRDFGLSLGLMHRLALQALGGARSSHVCSPQVFEWGVANPPLVPIMSRQVAATKIAETMSDRVKTCFGLQIRAYSAALWSLVPALEEDLALSGLVLYFSGSNALRRVHELRGVCREKNVSGSQA